MKKVTNDEVVAELKRVYGANGNRAPKQAEWKSFSAFSVDVLYRAFGSYTDAWKAAGHDYGTAELKKADIIDALKTAFVKDRTLGVGELIRASGYTIPTIMKYFGSTHAALQIAKIDLNKHIPDLSFVEEFRRVYALLGRIPTAKDIGEHAKYAFSTYRRRFGSLEAVVGLAGLELDTKIKETDEELLSELKRVCDELGRAPTILDLSKSCRFSQMSYRRAFGSFSAALKRIGYAANTNLKVSAACPVCGAVSTSMISHVKDTHPDEYKRQEERVVELFKSGQSQRDIAVREDVIFHGATSVARVVRAYLTAEEIEECRRAKIKSKLTEEYAAGKYDWVGDLNRKRNATTEAKEKNSAGCRAAYENGTRASWNRGQTKETNPIIAASAIKISEHMKYRFVSGEVEKQLGPESANWNDNRNEVAGRYRLGLNFTSEQRGLIKKRAEYRCERCKVSQEQLEEGGKTLECDHVTPICNGGLNDWETNGQALCPGCHRAKTDDDAKKGGIQ
jgi:hypothetical protein